MKLLFYLFLWLRFQRVWLFSRGLYLFFHIIGRNPAKHTKCILLIRPDGLGDMLVSLTAIRALYLHFHSQGYKIVLIHSKCTLPLLEQCPFIDKLITVDTSISSLFSSYWRRIYADLRSLYPEYAVNFLFLPKAGYLDHLLTFFSGAKYKCTIDSCVFVSKNLQFQEYSSIASSYIKKLQQTLLPNSVRSMIQLKAFCSFWQRQYNVMPCPSGEMDLFSYENSLVESICHCTIKHDLCVPYWLSYKQEKDSAPYYIVVPTANFISKTWPEAKFAKFIHEYSRFHPEMTAIITGTSKDKQVADTIISLLPQQVKCKNLCGMTSLLQLFALIRNADFLVGNDTGAAHIAGILGIYEIVLVGGGHYGLYFPNRQYKKLHVVTSKRSCFQCHFLCHGLLDGRYPCISQIPVESVLKYALEKPHQ